MIQNESRDPNGGNVYYVIMQITFLTRKFRNVERNLHCAVVHITTVLVSSLTLDCNGDFAIKAYWIRNRSNKMSACFNEFNVSLNDASLALTNQHEIIWFCFSKNILSEHAWLMTLKKTNLVVPRVVHTPHDDDEIAPKRDESENPETHSQHVVGHEIFAGRKFVR